ncbi:TetR/AcrR family transcriptional regulator [Desertivirga brevis]|uniref:TetR/AcrR family transcriptional regulator n=1 Tax=Desertivirga brevis TaxID=2810310 RepID=UPI001A9580E3|nr:TetR/AcrR family transcriptional regulator [Pedobacter sp. SYSU D00873]
MENQDRKREVIIEAAIKRFAHFGLAKTTMTEIASDLSLSKALLYYYFPDKINLYAAVLDHLVKHIGEEIRLGLTPINNSVEALNFYLTQRHQFLKKYANVFESVRTTEIPQQLIEVLEKAKQTEIEQISLAVQKQQELSIDATEAAGLLFDAFIGMRIPVFHSKKTFQLDPEIFESLLERQKKLGEIFLKGLSL